MTNKRRNNSRKLQPLVLAKQSVDSVTQIMEFIKKNYRIEINRYDHKQVRIKSLKRDYIFPPSLDDISLHMHEEEVSHSEAILKKILHSPNRTAVYDPIRDYFNSVRELEPEVSQIDKLLSHITVREFGDKPSGYYTERASRLIRKWLVATAACAMRKFPNEAMLVLIGEEEGQGKTWLSKFLCPDQLQDMYQLSSSDRGSFNLEHAVVSKFMISYDEMAGLTPTVAEEFKKAIIASSLDVKLRQDLSPLKRHRIGSLVGTTNNRTGRFIGFLRPSYGTRRFICIHIDTIDFGFSENVNIDELWAEAIHLSENPDYNYRLTQKDYDDFEEFNQRYMIETPASSIIQQAFCVPGDVPSEADQWMTATDIVMELRSRRLVTADISKHINPQRVGEAMRSLGFVRKSIHDPSDRTKAYKYNVQRIE